MTPEVKASFFASGQLHVAHILNSLRQYIDPAFAPNRILDFGCGVGRLVIPFAKQAADVVGMDISPSMLDEARANCAQYGVTNARLVLSDDDLSLADGVFDLVHSCIVFQHIELARGTRLFASLVERIKPGGAGALHVTFGWTAHAGTYGQLPPPVPPPPPSLLSMVKQSLKPLRPLPQRAPPVEPPAEEADPEMQMNYYNLSELTFILHRAGVQQVHTQLTDHGGALGAFLFFRVPPSAAVAT